MLSDSEYWLLLPPAFLVVLLAFSYVRWLSWELFVNN